MEPQPLLLAFHSTEITPEIEAALAHYRPAGVTLFRHLNLRHPEQIRRLTQGLQDAARKVGLPPLLIAADQEGGQLMAVPNTTQLPGNMALGATRDPELAYLAGRVLGRELAALGIQVNYAPVCDVNSNPENPVIGLRSFGEEPKLVAEMSAAMVRGIQSVGVAATAKHFPGHGDTAHDSHLGQVVLSRSVDELRREDWLPFRAAVDAGVQLVMVGHIAVPAIDGRDAPPATLSPRALAALRHELGFRGVTVTDALDMQALSQGDALRESATRAFLAGNDLLLLTDKPEDWRRVSEGLTAATQHSQGQARLQEARRHLRQLRDWLAQAPLPPDLAVVGDAAHRAIADKIARRALTLVQSSRHILPFTHLSPTQRLGVVAVKPFDMTPADTTATVQYSLAALVRSYHGRVEEVWVSHQPDEGDIAAVVHRARRWDAILIGTHNAYRFPTQAALVRRLLALGKPTVVAALRLPYDLVAFPEAPVYICTYGVLQPNLQALVQALFGEIPFRGRLPVSLPGLYPVGHGLQTLP